MDFKVKKVFLEAVLDRLMSITVKSGHQEKCASFGFIPLPGSDNRVGVLRMNGEVTGVVRLNIDTGGLSLGHGMFFIKDSYLYNLVKNLPENSEIGFSLDKNKIKVYAGGFNATWLLWEAPSEEAIRNLTSIEDEKFKDSKDLGVVDRKDFLDVVNRVLYAVPKFTFQANKQRIVLTKEGGRASDLYSCYQEISGKKFNLKEEIHIPLEAFPLFKFVKSSVEEKIEIRELDDKIYFILGSDYFVYIKQGAGFSESVLKQNIPEKGANFHIEVGYLRSIIERVGAVDEDNKIIELDASSGKNLIIRASDKVGNKSSEKIPINIEGSEDLKDVKVDWLLLKDSLSAVKDETTEMGFRGNYLVLNSDDSHGILSLVQ